MSEIQSFSSKFSEFVKTGTCGNAFYDYITQKNCTVCKYPIVDTHHIIPKHLGGNDSRDNLVWLCPNHHRAFHILLNHILYKCSCKLQDDSNAKCMHHLELIDKEMGFFKLIDTDMWQFFESVKDKILKIKKEGEIVSKY